MARKEFETWENNNRSEIWVTVTDAKGELVSKRVPPRGRLDITTEDRQRFNQDAAYNRDSDWFSNGALTKATLIDTTDDREEIESNPNTKSESEIADLLKLDANRLKKELAAINSPLVLQRLKGMVEGDAADKAEGLTVAKVNAVQKRYEELNPKAERQKVFDSYEESIAKPTTLSN